MKNNKHKLIILILILTGISCQKDFLELYPKGRLNADNFYNSVKDFQQALVGAYVPLRDIADNAYLMDEMRSDNTHYTYNPKDRGSIAFEQLGDFTENSQNDFIGDRYTAGYRGISRCNVILDRLEKIAFKITDTEKNQIVGEAKALRAHYYFDLVRHYGPLPLHLHEVQAIPEASLPRTGVDDIYKQIIKDFLDALPLLNPPIFPQSGRITKGMAATELALVYMTRKDWSSAIPLLQSVATMGYGLMANYADAFSLSHKNGIESIFEVQYKAGNDGHTNSFIYRFMPVGNVLVTLGVNYTNTNFGGWNVPTRDIIDTYEGNDKRLNASIGVVEGVINSSADFAPTRVTDFVGYSPTPGTAYRLFVKKYYHYPYTQTPSRGVFFAFENWPIFRFSDALLMLAESLNEMGKGDQALPHLNRVRSRAGLADITTTNQSQLRLAIAKERRTELAFENKRWLDLVRTGNALTVMNQYGEKLKQTNPYLLPSSYNVTENKLIFAIPYREIQLNNSLTQNPGY